MRDGIVGVIHASTKFISVCMYKVPEFQELSKSKQPITMRTPRNGWFEQDPMEIINLIHKASEEAVKQLKFSDYEAKNILSIGITNQRETLVVWDLITCKPLYRAILWKDIRSARLADDMINDAGDIDKYAAKTGLPISSNFTALKLKWLIENVPQVATAVKNKRCRVGTLDSWIIWNLTNSALFITDVTNASRTMLMNLATEDWDADMLRIFELDKKMLPVIKSCSEIYGTIINEKSPLCGVRLSGIIANQQAVLLGQFCIKPGQIKCSYDTGAFIMANTGTKLVHSRNGLITTVAYKLGPQAKTHYALEGGFSAGCHIFNWLTDNLLMLPTAEAAEDLADGVPNSGGVFFVPALTGLYAPHWNSTARGILIGLTQTTKKAHIIRAAMEAISFQTGDILESIARDSGQEPEEIYVDCDAKQPVLMQSISNLCSIKVNDLKTDNCIELGAVFCATQAPGLNILEFNTEQCFHKYNKYEKYSARLAQDAREECYKLWKQAIPRCFDWVKKDMCIESAESGESMQKEKGRKGRSCFKN